MYEEIKSVQFRKKGSLGNLRLQSNAEKELVIVKEKLHYLHKNNRKGSVRARPHWVGLHVKKVRLHSMGLHVIKELYSEASATEIQVARAISNWNQNLTMLFMWYLF